MGVTRFKDLMVATACNQEGASRSVGAVGWPRKGTAIASCEQVTIGRAGEGFRAVAEK